MDIFTKEKRSDVMSRIHSEDTGPEMMVRGWLREAGVRFRMHDKRVVGHPDFVMRDLGMLVEVRGCFWHRHNLLDKGCRLATCPKSNVGYWEEKFRKNVLRDRAHELVWANEGWRVLVVWECWLRGVRAIGTRRRVLGEALCARMGVSGGFARRVVCDRVRRLI